MKAIRISEAGGPEVLRLEEMPEPVPGPHDVLVEVRAAGMNRADLLQRRGSYPAPDGSPADVPGLEFAGVVVRTGNRVRRHEPGDRVMGLLGGGGYAERVVVHEGLALPVPERLDLVEAAAVPEVFFTAYDALFTRGAFRTGDRVLVHSAGGGVGTAALQLCRLAGVARVFGTASGGKLEGLRELGLSPDVPIDYRTESFREVVRRETEGAGVDVILDTVGAPYWTDNVASLAELGRLVLIGLLGGSRAEADLGALLRRRIRVVGTVLRARSLGEKLLLAREVGKHVLPALAEGRLRPVVDRSFPLSRAAEAHAYMHQNRNLGKILLLPGS